MNQNGVTTTQQTETTAAAATTTVTQQQTRPVTLNTSTATGTSCVNGKGLKSPKTPGNQQHHISATSTPTPTASQQNHNSTQTKTSPGSKATPKTPPVTPDSPSTYLDDDLDSLFSYGTTTSGRSTMSCEHPYVAR